MRLFFVRHGQSENNALWLNTGSRTGRKSDPQITQIGRRQIEHTARFLDYCLTFESAMQMDPSLAFEAGDIYVYCSLMERSIQSGLIIAEQLNVALSAFPEIHESGGMYHYDDETDAPIGEVGNPKSYFEKQYPQLILPEDTQEYGWWNREYETREERPQRAERVLKKLLNWHGASSDHVIFVSHAGFYNYFLRAVMHQEMDYGFWFELFNGAVSLLHFDEEVVRIYYTNRYEFMPVGIVS